MLSATKYKSKQCTGIFGLPNISTPTPGFWPTSYAWVKVNINPRFIHPFSLSVSFRAVLTWKNIDRLLLNTRPLTFNDIHFSLAINLNPTRNTQRMTVKSPSDFGLVEYPWAHASAPAWSPTGDDQEIARHGSSSKGFFWMRLSLFKY